MNSKMEESNQEVNKSKLTQNSAQETTYVFKGHWVRIFKLAAHCSPCNKDIFLHIECPYCNDVHFHFLDSMHEHFSKQHNEYRPQRELGIEDLADILGTTIKKDDTNKVITFFAMLSRELNIAFSAPASTGKSYLPEQVAAYFPQSEIVYLAGVSATASIHENGIQVIETEPNVFKSLNEILKPLRDEQIEITTKMDSSENKDSLEKRLADIESQIKELTASSKKLIDYRHKILILADQPQLTWTKRMRSFLSHDNESIGRYKITDSSNKHKAEEIVLLGPCAVIFCTTSPKFNDAQENTRYIILSTEDSPDKIEQSLELINEKYADIEEFRQKIKNDPKRISLQFRIELIRMMGIKDVVSKETYKTTLDQYKELYHKNYNSRQMREFVRILLFKKASAILNVFNREWIKKDDKFTKRIYNNKTDEENAFSLFKPTKDSSNFGLTPIVYGLYEYVGKNVKEPWYFDDFRTAWYNLHHTVETTYKLHEMLKELTTVGLIEEEIDPNDKRKSVYRRKTNLADQSLKYHSIEGWTELLENKNKP
jgi:hypothetical protein